MIDGNALCGHCITTPPPFDRLFALYQYEEPISSLIHQIKFQGNLLVANWISNEWIQFLENKSILPEAILPVPLHHARLSERGFNQTIEIAKPIGRFFNIPIDVDLK